MKIAIDIDDTITNSYEAITKSMCDYFKMDYDKVVQYGVPTEFFANLPNFKEYQAEYWEKTIARVDIKPHALIVLNELRKRGYHITIITSRNKKEFKDAYQFSLDFLEKNNIPYDELVVWRGLKGDYCEKNDIDILIDDLPRHIMSVKENTTPILFRGKHNKFYDTEYSISDWNELLTVLEKINYTKNGLL